MVHASKKLKHYFESIQRETERILKICSAARSMGFDPENRVDIPIAKNMAERVLNLVSAVAPALLDSGIADRIIELENEYSPMDWRVGFKIGEEVAKEKFCKFSSKKEAAEVGIRTGFTYLTGGIVSAPLEGFVEIKIKKTASGEDYVACMYSGPIRGAGGTAAATSVILSDYIATKLGYAKYDPSEEEINRITTELYDYNERVTNLQYLPSEEEIKFMIKHLPVEVDGDPTERLEVSNYKDVGRFDTNHIRGGICLVIAEGLCQKAPKLWKRLSVWGPEFGIDWSFLSDFLKLQKQIKAKGEQKKESSKITPNYTFINDIVAGRPVLAYPMAYGGFRLRMGRTRTSGFSAIALSPETLRVLNGYIVYGTQLKLERPGKAGSVTICECIDGPTVLLDNGEVIQITKDNKELVKHVKKILFLGDILINYGDFSENGHSLIPLGYCEEWWAQELEKNVACLFGTEQIDFQKLEGLVNISQERLKNIFKDIFSVKISFSEAISLSKKTDTPLHPSFIYYYSALNIEELSYLVGKFSSLKINYTDNEKTKIKSLVFQNDFNLKNILEKIGMPHSVASNEFIVISGQDAMAFAYTFGIREDLGLDINKDILLQNKDKSVLELINIFTDVIIRDKAGTFIGARMGRPEKAKMRKLQGSPQVLFPVGEEGGRLKSFQSSMDSGEVSSDFPLYYCDKCKKNTVYKVCHICGENSSKIYFCYSCNKNIASEKCNLHPETEIKSYKNMTINIHEYVNSCLEIMKTKVYPDLIKGVKDTSNKDHVPEHLIKGFLRAKHNLYVNKDGTTRYDMSESPITAFKPVEISTPLAKLKEIGYTEDIYGNKLEDENQIVEIFPQDVILPLSDSAMEEQADEILFRIGNFVDDLLKMLYKQKRFYNFKSKLDIIGCLIVCLAPHISCGTVGRVIGFSKNQVLMAHPMMHAAVRRDCDGDEACFILMGDAFLNFSRQFLPDKRGSRTMDAPLVLSTLIIPSEVDDQVHGLDVVWKYPLGLYDAAQKYMKPWDIEITQLKDRLNTEKQYEGFGFTHPVNNINSGLKVSAYKTLPSMREKLEGQMDLATRISAVDASAVAKLVINKHFLKDIKGNLRKFSTQQFRCIKCNSKFVRPPLIGKCPKCGGRIIFTISEGSVIKYLGPSIDLASKYDVPAYLKQTLELTQERVDSVFGKEKEVQEGLSKFF
jgi:DNA polymerase II large subunit